MFTTKYKYIYTSHSILSVGWGKRILFQFWLVMTFINSTKLQNWPTIFRHYIKNLVATQHPVKNNTIPSLLIAEKSHVAGDIWGRSVYNYFLWWPQICCILDFFLSNFRSIERWKDIILIIFSFFNNYSKCQISFSLWTRCQQWCCQIIDILLICLLYIKSHL